VNPGGSGASPGKWQRRALRSVLPAGFTLFSLWVLWFVMTLLDGAMTPLGVVQTVLGLAASVALVLVGSAYRRVIGEA
jgi:apolipoprotein N-acyltransferase